MEHPNFEVRMELDGWRLFWARLTVETVDGAVFGELRDRVAASARERFADTSEIGAHPTVAALRRLFRAAGCDPTRYRPSSEALLRRLVKGDPIPDIQPLVDLNNCLSAELAVPCCVMREGSFGSRMVLRSGLEGEGYESLRGPFKLEGKPVLVDEDGPLDTPITGNVRVKVSPETEVAWLVAYMPADLIDLELARVSLGGLVQGIGIRAEYLD
jgi:DNA/RNA-binding domain of Phe-tRNA-synthetase-like protein